MTAFDRCEGLAALGFEHGLGRRGSAEAPPPGLVTARQVHGTRLLRVPFAETAPEADALFTSERGVAVGVRTADCVPILLADAGGGGVAAVHAGWRGSSAGIAELAVAGFCEALGIAPSQVRAVVGPHIGPCCYEVDDPVRDVVSDSSVFTDAARAGHYLLDLFALNRGQLLSAGVPEDGVWRVGDCTSCHPELYPSYRRDGSSDRLLHYVRSRD